MRSNDKRLGASAPRLFGFFRRYRWDRRANVSTMVALMLVPMIGAFAMGGEVASWFTTQRALQNVADSAAVAAATAADTAYNQEAAGVAANYGYVNGANNVTISSSNTANCPDGSGAKCYSVTINKTVPLLLVGIVGYRDSGVTLNGAPAQLISATAIASSQGSGAAPLCILALGTGGSVIKDLTVNGGPKSDLGGHCSVGSNGAATCNGQPLGGVISSYAASGDTNDCAPTGDNFTEKSTIADPYSSLADSIPTNTCGPSAADYPQENGGTGGTPVTANQLQGNLSGTVIVCGDAGIGTMGLDKKGNPVYNPGGSITLAAGTVLVIENGQLDTSGGATVNATNGATIIFGGLYNGSQVTFATAPSHFPTGGGTLNITAPTSGTWKGIALYQDPGLTTGIDISAAGNTPTWNIQGIVYAPNASVTIDGIVNKNATNNCIGFVVGIITISGTGQIVNQTTNCAPISAPGIGSGSRVALVQ